jgi:hypothetical protein
MISRKDCFTEIKSPSDVEKMEEPNMLGLIYKAIYMCIRLLLDVRTNNVLIAKKLGLELKSDKVETSEVR